ncbi:SulP family inorganic anion transporter [Terrabacter carboxydivorans]|uniref:STAS domain-containing protein n=1 Tax=Terrabacter carboxydivorans TaxID=619730 RepID=A0ABN3LBT4_9MICO
MTALAPWVRGYRRAWLRPDVVAGLTVWAVLVAESLAYATIVGVPPVVGLYAAVPVLKGFIVGLALTIILGQVPKLLDVDKPEGGFFRSAWTLVTELGDVHWLSAVVGIGALVLVTVLRRVAPRLPGSLVVVALGIAAVRLLSLDERGVAIVGPIDAGLPSLGLPGSDPSQYLELAGPAVGVLLIAFVEGLAAAKAYAARLGYELDTDRELTALGAANVGSGLLGGMVVNGSLSKTAVNGAAGARSQASNVLVGALTVVTLLFLTGLFESLPEPVLAAVVIAAVVELVDVASLRRLYAVWSAPLGRIYRRAARADFIAAVGALLGVLVLDTLPGLFVGVLLSLVLLLYRTSRPHVARLVRQPGVAGEWLDATRHPELAAAPDVVVVRVESGLYFVNAEHVRDEIRAAVTPATRAVVVDASAVPAIDVSAADMLAQLESGLGRDGIRLHLAAGIGQVRDVVGAAEADDVLAGIHDTVDDAVAAARREAADEG